MQFTPLKFPEHLITAPSAQKKTKLDLNWHTNLTLRQANLRYGWTWNELQNSGKVEEMP